MAIRADQEVKGKPGSLELGQEEPRPHRGQRSPRREKQRGRRLGTLGPACPALELHLYDPQVLLDFCRT
jgi:hypothetical protein